jgi:hypothetical protein
MHVMFLKDRERSSKLGKTQTHALPGRQTKVRAGNAGRIRESVRTRRRKHSAELQRELKKKHTGEVCRTITKKVIAKKVRREPKEIAVKRK